MPKVEVINNVLKVKAGPFQSKEFKLDALRLCYLIVPESFRWYVVQSSQSRSFVNLDPIAEESFKDINKAISDLVKEQSAFALSDLKVLVADYSEQFATFSLKDVKKYQPDFFDHISYTRNERIKRVKNWMQGNPEVLLKGILWHKAVINKDGFKKGDKLFVSWKEVETVLVETTNGMACVFYVLPKGVSGGTFSFAKGKYGISISPGKGDLFTAECNFWRNLSAQQQEIEAAKLEPQELLEQTIQNYISSGYKLVSKGETTVLEKKVKEFNLALFLILLFVFFPVGIAYVVLAAKGKPHRLKLKLGTDGELITETESK